MEKALRLFWIPLGRFEGNHTPPEKKESLGTPQGPLWVPFQRVPSDMEPGQGSFF